MVFSYNHCTPPDAYLVGGMQLFTHLQPLNSVTSRAVYICTHVITSRKLRLKQMWRLTKAIAKMKPDTEQTMKLEQLHKVGSEYELTHGLMAQSVKASEWNSVVVGSNPTQVNFLQLLQRILRW